MEMVSERDLLGGNHSPDKAPDPLEATLTSPALILLESFRPHNPHNLAVMLDSRNGSNKRRETEAGVR